MVVPAPTQCSLVLPNCLTHYKYKLVLVGLSSPTNIKNNELGGQYSQPHTEYRRRGVQSLLSRTADTPSPVPALQPRCLRTSVPGWRVRNSTGEKRDAGQECLGNLTPFSRPIKYAPKPSGVTTSLSKANVEHLDSQPKNPTIHRVRSITRVLARSVVASCNHKGGGQSMPVCEAQLFPGSHTPR